MSAQNVGMQAAGQANRVDPLEFHQFPPVFVNTVRLEANAGLVRVIFGDERNSQIVGRCSVVMPLNAFAKLAANSTQLLDLIKQEMQAAQIAKPPVIRE